MSVSGRQGGVGENDGMRKLHCHLVRRGNGLEGKEGQERKTRLHCRSTACATRRVEEVGRELCMAAGPVLAMAEERTGFQC